CHCIKVLIHQHGRGRRCSSTPHPRSGCSSSRSSRDASSPGSGRRAARCPASGSWRPTWASIRTPRNARWPNSSDANCAGQNGRAAGSSPEARSASTPRAPSSRVMPPTSSSAGPADWRWSAPGRANFWRSDGTARGRTDLTTTPLTYRTAEEPDMSESTSPLAAPLVEATGLTKRYGSIAALDGFDVSLGPGQVVGLLGENGCGKTTLLKILAGVLSGYEGEVR